MPLDNVLLILKGTSPSAKCRKNVPFDQSFKNVPNDYRIRSKATPQVEDGQRATSRANKLAWKRQGIDLLVMPCLLNDKLSLWAARSVDRSAVR